jgi:sugar porter (SP) family MFS transporter
VKKKSGLALNTTLIAAIAGLITGFDTGIIGGALGFISESFALSSLGKGIMVSMVLAGGIAGALINGAVSDRLGRKAMIIGAGVLYAAGAAGSALSPNPEFLQISRFVLGLAIGAACASAPLYIAEISPAEKRGMLVTFFQLAITMGILAGYFLAKALSGSENWRLMLAGGVLPAAGLVAGMITLPNSPRWLIRMGRSDEARRILEGVSGGDALKAGAEVEEIKRVLAMERKTGLSEVLKPPVSYALAAAAGLFILQQFSGINSVMYYAPVIFREAGLGSADTALLATVSVGIVNVLATLIAVWLLDRAGRKPLLYAGFGGMFLSLVAVGIIFALNSQPAGGTGAAIVPAVWLYVACFAFSLGPVPWLMMTEVFPLSIRGRAVGLVTMAGWGSNIIISLSFLPLMETIGISSTFWAYAVISFLGIFFVWRLVPETKGRTLEEIERDLLTKK